MGALAQARPAFAKASTGPPEPGGGGRGDLPLHDSHLKHRGFQSGMADLQSRIAELPGPDLAKRCVLKAGEDV